ncbi:MAG: helix-turn-helix transcriptional regulator [Candidatus Eremiobacteraeota bacterium]|nr:helix-turn-helix transcriptional regulator [Candidatus Eremiobacteraeota bacterium]
MPVSVKSDVDAQVRAVMLRARLAELGLTLAEFGRRSGLSRNVVYRLSKGGKPTPEQVAAMKSMSASLMLLSSHRRLVLHRAFLDPEHFCRTAGPLKGAHPTSVIVTKKQIEMRRFARFTKS